MSWLYGCHRICRVVAVSVCDRRRIWQPRPAQSNISHWVDPAQEHRAPAWEYAVQGLSVVHSRGIVGFSDTLWIER